MQIEDYLGYLLVQLIKAHHDLAEKGLNDLGLHTGQEMILLQLYEQDGLTQTQLAEMGCVEPPTITKKLSRMESSGFVCRRTDPDDARVSRVYLTENSRALEKPVVEVWSQLEARLVEGLTDTERALLRRLLVQMLDNLSRELKP
jgi:DNA-binding MarR family transcriptional regulator